MVNIETLTYESIYMMLKIIVTEVVSSSPKIVL